MSPARSLSAVPLIALCHAVGSALPARTVPQAPARQEPCAAADVAGLEHFRGSDAARALLLEQGFVVVAGGGLPAPDGGTRPLLHVFSAYVDAPLPPFVAPDLLIAAHAALLERAVAEQERLLAPRLLAFSTKLRERALEIGDRGGRELAAMAAAAIALQQGEARIDGGEVRRFLKPGAARLLEPAGEGDDADFAAYCRARRFWQLVEPRPHVQQAFARCLDGDRMLVRLRERLLAPAVALVGPPAGDPATAGVLPGSQTPLHAIAERCDEAGLPDLPGSGLALLAAGPLASPAGARIWRTRGIAPDLAALTGAVDATDSLFGRLLGALRLLQEPDPRGEPVFHAEAWAHLQANAQLGGWALARHAHALQAQWYVTRGLHGSPPGRVAPYPGFFAALEGCAAGLRTFRCEMLLADGDRAALQERCAATSISARRCTSAAGSVACPATRSATRSRVTTCSSTRSMRRCAERTSPDTRNGSRSR